MLGAARHPPSSSLLLRRLDALRELLRDCRASAYGGSSGRGAPVAPTSRRTAASSAAAAPPTCDGDGGAATTTTTTTTTWTVSRAFSQADVDAFVTLTGDANPIHRAAAGRDAAAAGGGGGAAAASQPPLVPGLLLASLFPAIIGSRFSGAVYARQSLRFRAPARVGEAVEAVVSLAEQGERGRGGGKGGGGGEGGGATAPSPSSSRVAFDTVVRRAEDGRVLVEGSALAIIPLEAQMRARVEGFSRAAAAEGARR